MSAYFMIKIGMRQCGVLSPSFFAIYLDDTAKYVCMHAHGSTLSIVLYADDIISISSSIHAL